MAFHGPYGEGPFQQIRKIKFPKEEWRFRLIARHTKNTGGIFGMPYDGAVMVQGLIGDRFIDEYFPGDPLQGGVVYFLPAKDIQFDAQDRAQLFLIMTALVPDNTTLLSVYLATELNNGATSIDWRVGSVSNTGGAAIIAGGYITKAGMFEQFQMA